MQTHDIQNLVDQELLQVVTKHHPLRRDIASELKSLTVREKTGQDIRMEMDPDLHAVLYIHPILRPSMRDKYILYHEFGHIADRLNPGFGYRHEERLKLTPWQEQNFLELWNVFIDSRLNRHGLFCLPSSGQSEFIVDGKRYVLPRSDVNTYLLEAITHLTQRGMYRPGSLITTIWNNPHRFLSFRDLLEAVL